MNATLPDPPADIELFEHRLHQLVDLLNETQLAYVRSGAQDRLHGLRLREVAMKAELLLVAIREMR